MAAVEEVVAAPPRRIFDVLADGWSYSDWVVGTAHVRDVDEDWPRRGARLRHQVGPWPLSLHGTSTVLCCEDPHRLVLRAGLGPLGAAVIAFTLAPVGAAGSRVRVVEHFVAGPLRWLDNKVNDLVLHRRNREMLHRLAEIATRQENGNR